MIRWIVQAWQTVKRVIWPERVQCLLCEEFSHGEWLCSQCKQALEGLRLQHESGNLRSAYRYHDAAKQLVTSLKFECMADAAQVLAAAMAEEARDMQLPADTVVTWVTMPRSRRRERGIDHGRTLADAVAMELGLPVVQLLKRKRNVPTQRGLGLEARQRNLVGAFACEQSLKVTVLLVDDVMTTGATAAACANVLMEAGSPAVYVITATKVPACR